MDMPFEIKFDFAPEYSPYTIALKARVRLHASETYYVVDSFLFEKTDQSKSSRSILPEIEIKYLKTATKGIWVHKDSERESLLSRTIGQAIAKSGRIYGLINLCDDSVK